MKEELKNITNLLFQAHGIDISIYDDSFLIKAAENRLSATNSSSFNDYFNYLKGNKEEVAVLLNSLNINFSEFFRNPLTFAYLEQVVLPALIEKKKKSKENEIRIWSAACAAGHEAYSIAILLDEIIENAKTNTKYRIFATDINQAELANALKGNYQNPALSKVNLKRIQTYFTHRGDNYTIAPQLKEHIDFSVFDLLTDQGVCPPASIYGNFDVVFCSNLLFYYKSEYQQQILEKVGGCLTSGGILVTGETEREIVKENGYREAYVNSGIFRKNRE